jgi:hypothetical protein
MNSTEVRCSQCGMIARHVSFEGQIFPASSGEKPALTQVIDCPQCGRREQPAKGGGASNSPDQPI